MCFDLLTDDYGVLTTGGPGIYDVCEKEATDVLDYLSPQQREDITASAQVNIRLITFVIIISISGHRHSYGKQVNFVCIFNKLLRLLLQRFRFTTGCCYGDIKQS